MAQAATKKTPAKTVAKTAAKTTAKTPAKMPVKKAAAKAPAKAVKAPAVAPAKKKAAAPVKAKAKTKSVAAAAKPAPVAKPKVKLVRDSFTMPRGDHDLISLLKTRSLVLQRVTKKSELLRAGLHALAALGDKALLVALSGLQPLKAGRPKKD